MTIRDLVFLKQPDTTPDYMELVFNTALAPTNTIIVTPREIGPQGVWVDWGDGAVSPTARLSMNALSHTYSVAGVYTVRIYGDLVGYGSGIYSGGVPYGSKLTRVNKFNSATKKLDYAFAQCINLQFVPDSLPVGVTSLRATFGSCSPIATQNIANWDTSSVVSMQSTFAMCPFNVDISNWNTSDVITMSGMFWRSTAFNQNISTWNVSKVTNMHSMFLEAWAFDQNLSSWTTKLSDHPTDFSLRANQNFADNTNNLKPFLADGVTRIAT